MKKSLLKTISMVLALMFAFTAVFVIGASAESQTVTVTQDLHNPDSAGDAISQSGKVRDIYLVLDISGSMSGVPLSSLKDAAKQFCAIMLNDKNASNRIAIVTYNTNVNTYSFSTNYAQLANTIDSFDSKGSTAMYDALMAVKEINEKYGNKDATKHIVVMADGLPNEGATLSSGKYTAKDSSMYYKYGNAVYSTAAGMWPDYKIYSIGFFHNLGGTQLEYGKTLMKDIQNALYLEVFDPDKIEDAFGDIAEEITKPDTTETTTKAPATTETTTANNNNNNNNNSIPQTGETLAGVAVAAVVMASAIAFVAVKKRDE